MILSEIFKNLAFSILDKSKFRGFNLFRDLRFYSSQFNLSIDTVFDVGANIGQTSKEIRRYFPDSSIHAFEPVNLTFESLKENLSQDRKIILNNLALGAEKKEVTITLNEESCINSLLNEASTNEKNKQIQTIAVIKGDEYCNLNTISSIFLLKTDTEGYDLDVLKGCESIISSKKVFFILVEVTFNRKNPLQTSFYTVNEYLTSHGYKLSGFYDLMHYGGFKPDLNYCNCLWSFIV
jgi:FkbM family methyltransferase